MFFLITNFLAKGQLLNEEEVDVGEEIGFEWAIGWLIGIWVGGAILSLIFLIIGYKLIKYGVNNDSVIAIVIGVLLAWFWLGILFYYLLNKKKEKKDKEKEAAKRREEEILRNKTSK